MELNLNTYLIYLLTDQRYPHVCTNWHFLGGSLIHWNFVSESAFWWNWRISLSKETKADSVVLHFFKKCYTLGLHYSFSGVVLVQANIYIFHPVYLFFDFEMMKKVKLIMSELKITKKCVKLNEICEISAYTSTSKKCSVTLKCSPKV